MTGRAVGIDIGGTKIAVATVDEGGEIRSEASLPTESRRGFDSALGRIRETIARGKETQHA